MRNVTYYAFLLLVMFFPTVVQAQSFSDVPISDPDYVAIQDIAQRGIANGPGDGTFRPDQPVSRAEAVKFVARAVGLDCVVFANTEPQFSDTASAIGLKEFIECMRVKGHASGYGDGRFGPQNTVLGPELLKMLYRAAGIAVDMTNPPRYTDLTDTSLTPYIARAIANDVRPRTVNNRIGNAPLLRRDVARYVHAFIEEELENSSNEESEQTSTQSEGAITEEEAIAIAEEHTGFDANDVEIERKLGKEVYVVEVDDDGEEVDVLIDMETGEVLGVE